MKDRASKTFVVVGFLLAIAAPVPTLISISRELHEVRADCQKHAGNASSAWRLAREHSDMLDQHDDEIERLAKHAGLERTERRVSPLNDDGGKQ